MLFEKVASLVIFAQSEGNWVMHKCPNPSRAIVRLRWIGEIGSRKILLTRP